MILHSCQWRARSGADGNDLGRPSFVGRCIGQERLTPCGPNHDVNRDPGIRDLLRGAALGRCAAPSTAERGSPARSLAPHGDTRDRRHRALRGFRPRFAAGVLLGGRRAALPSARIRCGSGVRPRTVGRRCFHRSPHQVRRADLRSGSGLRLPGSDPIGFPSGRESPWRVSSSSRA